MPKIAVSVSELQFGLVRRDSSRILTIAIANGGTDTPRISEIAYSVGVFKPGYTSQAIPPSEVKELAVTFTPTAPILYQDTLTLVHNDPDTTAIRIPMTGQGIKPAVELSRATLSFGDILVSYDSLLTVQVRNRGNDTLLVQEMIVSEPTFVIASPDQPEPGAEIEVPPGDSLAVQVICAPADTGGVSATLTVHSNDPDNPQTTADLTGRGVAPIAYYSSVSYGLSTEKGDDISFDLHVSNLGNYPLHYEIIVDAVWVTYEWLSVSPASGQVAAGDVGLIQVNVIETANLDEGQYDGCLYLRTNSGNDPGIMTVTDTVNVDLVVLPEGTLASGDTSIPVGNSDPIELIDNDGNSLGIIVDFIASGGGSVQVTSVHRSPPVDTTTAVFDPDGRVEDPVYANCYWEITCSLPDGYVVDITFDYSAIIRYHQSR